MSRGTPHRTIRIEDALWLPAKAKAKAEDIHLSDMIREALRAYLEAPSVDDGGAVFCLYSTTCQHSPPCAVLSTSAQRVGRRCVGCGGHARYGGLGWASVGY